MTLADRPHRSGTLYVLAVPIGHPDDITVRAIQILSQVGIIASEDPTVTQRLLAHHDIQALVTSYGPRNLKEKAAVLLQRLRHGVDIALVSDCGSPLVADPGQLLVAEAHRHGIPVVPVPGPSVLIAALTVAGLSCDSFYFLGYLPPTSSRIALGMIDSLRRDVPTVAFCTTATLARALKTLSNIAPQRLVVLVCDVTKPTEIIVRGSVDEVRQHLHRIRGREITLVLSGRGHVESDDHHSR
jgi:16S rRNA (cytidine1402-2'-O)-methyltransferase